MISSSADSALGICVGASTIKLVECQQLGDTLRLRRHEIIPHDCHTRACLEQVLERYPPAAYRYTCVTGRKQKELVNLPAVTEPEAVEQALQFVMRTHGVSEIRWNALLSLGSENFIVYELDEAGLITGVRTGNKCGSGTGEFFLQQLRRMDISLADSSGIACSAEPYEVCGRCTVFCKSDCTHALNKGIPTERVLAGLGNMIADKALEILGSLPRQNVMVVGGVTKNTYVMQQLQAKIDNLFVPPEADLFEALGAAACAWRRELRGPQRLEFRSRHSAFGSLRPLREAEPLVTFRQHQRGTASPGDATVLGLDVGSTTTKAVLLRSADNRVLASVYLRTNGNPIQAARECYAEILQQLNGCDLPIRALGVTGSGRHIAGLHAQSDAVINEIIAHATAAAHFESDVDTILEIGGQDAKYTYLVNGVPCDYAMNEACSAGTGSFLEEAASESLNVDYRDIEKVALRADKPPNFNDQCAAFISSDIKNAAHDLSRENIVAGLVYSICMNYSNRVRGSRKIGRKVFMQGGVCYNRAVPLAMASLLGQPIVVPPDPGLMGAFGVALEAQQRVAMGLLDPGSFDLAELTDREVSFGKSFTCPGTSQRCDRGCDINVIRLNGKSYPFGGACNKYYNITHHLQIDPEPYDYVTRRQKAVFADEGQSPDNDAPAADNGAPTVGLSRSFLVNLLYPLYAAFFNKLGCRLVLPDAVDPEGMKQINSSFCHPAVISHGMLSNLIGKEELDYLFLPHIHELHVEQGQSREPGHQCTCITALAEPYYLRSAFPGLRAKVLAPQLNFAAGWESMERCFVELACQLGRSAAEGVTAYEYGTKKLMEFFAARRKLGEEALSEIERDPDQAAIVLFGRPYNAFAEEANMGIPRKFASRGVRIVPFDCLPFADEPVDVDMNWAMGQDLLRAAHLVKKHPQLFGAFVTNFGCGPDSFLVGYFRDIMQTKPSLTLEIDGHTADAGINTRVEAFLDIVDRYRRLQVKDPIRSSFRKAKLVLRRGKPFFRDSCGNDHSLRDPRVKMLVPSMGRTSVEAASATFVSFGLRAEPVPFPDDETLAMGRGHTCCKECLPLILSVGSLTQYLEHRQAQDELLLYFMPSTNGNCRLPQYSVFIQKLIEQKQLPDVAIFTLTSENGYSGLGTLAASKLLRSVMVADVIDDIKNAILVLADDKERALQVLEVGWQSILTCISRGGRGFYRQLNRLAKALAAVPRRASIDDARRVLLAGEIFVRKDEFSSQAVVQTLAEKGIVVQRAPVTEWLQFIDYWVLKVDTRRRTLAEDLELRLRLLVTGRMEKRIKKTLARSGFYRFEMSEIEKVVEAGEKFVDRSFGGETNLVIGRFLKDALVDFHGLISIGPFACMPTRIIESILTPESKRMHACVGAEGADTGSPGSIPFLSIEADGNPFPQTIEAQLEAFCLRVQRLS